MAKDEREKIAAELSELREQSKKSVSDYEQRTEQMLEEFEAGPLRARRRVGGRRRRPRPAAPGRRPRGRGGRGRPAPAAHRPGRLRPGRPGPGPADLHRPRLPDRRHERAGHVPFRQMCIGENTAEIIQIKRSHDHAVHRAILSCLL